MPEVKDLSEALPETSMDPITGVGVVASRNRAPTGYDVVSPDPLIQPMFIPCAQEPPSLVVNVLLPSGNLNREQKRHQWEGVGSVLGWESEDLGPPGLFPGLDLCDGCFHLL